MNTNNTFKSKEESSSLNFGDSNLKVNSSNNNSTSALVSNGEISRENLNSIEKYDLGCPLPKSNNTDLGEEINRLAETWCELLLNQIQETQDIQMLRSDFEAKTNENIVSSLID